MWDLVVNVGVVKPTKNNIAAKWCSLTMPLTTTEALLKEDSPPPWSSIKSKQNQNSSPPTRRFQLRTKKSKLNKTAAT